MRELRDRRLLRLPLLLLLVAGPAVAATPEMILDINSSGVATDDQAGVASRFVPLGQKALVLIDEPSTGTELWVTDGTDAGTRPLLDRCPGECSGAGILMDAVVGGVGFFGIRSSGSEPALWRSDGTTAGTFVLVPGQIPCNSDFAVLGRTLYLSLGPPSSNPGSFPDCSLWKTDGTVAGTSKVPEVDGQPIELAATAGRLFFTTYDPIEGVGALWTTIGTPGAYWVRMREWTVAMPTHLYTVGDRLFFLAPDSGTELWVSDGTPDGTRPVTNFTPPSPFVPRYDGSSVYIVQALDDRLVFLANDGTGGREVWTSDGTAAGTRPVTAFQVASPFLGLDKWRVEKLGSRLVFPANDGTSGNRLWTSTGSAASVAPIAGGPELSPGAETAREGGRLAFVGGTDRSSLWVTDGTGPGTRRVLATQKEDGIAQLDALLGRIFFTAELGNNGDRFLLATDPALASTAKLTMIDVRELPIRPAAMGGAALFSLPTRTSRRELWRSDGTPAGTFPVTRIGQTGASSIYGQIVPAGDAVRFLALDEESSGLWTSRGTAGTTTKLTDPLLPAERLAPLGSLTLLYVYGSLWRSDGTTVGTFALTSTDEGDPSVFTISPLTNGRAVLGMRTFDSWPVWATDGSVAGTQKIFDLPDEFDFLSDIVAVGPEAFFVTTMSTHDDRLWVTDGTAAGTRAITGSVPKFIETPLQVARLGSAVFFEGDNDHVGTELWRSDGATAGTHPFAEERIGSPEALLVHRGKLYFFAPDLESSAYDIGLWKSDGTEAGTVLLHAWGRGDFSRAGLAPFGDLLVFAAEDEENGVEIWRTDGTAAGTVQIRDISPGATSSNPSNFEVLGNRLYFTANDKSHGNELWETDGTTLGTRLVQDIAPGIESSRPEDLTAAGGRLYFTADDGVHGREPWVYAPGGAACVPSDTVLCLRGGRFKVEADWRDFEGYSGRGHATTLTADTGYFWFFDPSNVEAILKVLDGHDLNGHDWVFYGALSTVEYSLTVTDTVTGAARRYTNVPGRLGSVADTEAFGPNGASAPGVVATGPSSEVGEAIVSSRSIEATSPCAASATRLCLQDGRFAVEARWKTPGQNGTGQAVPLAGGDTGYFWFFDQNNVEVVLKVLDGRPLNGKFWVFYGALSDVEYTLTVTDTVTGAVKTYTNPSGRLASVADTGAF